MPVFNHLHVASAHSTHYGTARPEELVAAAKAQGATVVALTDRDGLYGAVRHIRACKAAGVGAVVGAELLVGALDTPGGAFSTVTVLAHGNNSGQGWAALARLVSSTQMGFRRAKKQGLRGGIAARPVSRRSAFASLLVDETKQGYASVLLGAESDVGQALLKGENKLALAHLNWWKEQLPGQVVVEVSCLFAKPGKPGSLPHAVSLLELAHHSQTPAILTNQVRYLTPGDAITGDVLDSVGVLEPLGLFQEQPNGQAWLKPWSKMHKIARMVTEHSSLQAGVSLELLDETFALGQRCVLDPESDIGWQKPKVPELALLGIQGDPDQVLQEKCERAVNYRYPYASENERREVFARLDQELLTIRRFGFSSYFLTVADISNLMTSLGARHQARGSGVGSLVNYLLRISNADPLAHDLLFERFLGSARSTLPDIDIDVASDRRHDIYQAIFQKYGDHRVALLSMSSRYRTRGAIRDAGLALGLQQDLIDLVASNVWRFNARDFRQALSEKPELAQVAQMAVTDGKVSQLIDLSERLDRLPRHLSMHPCGVLLSDENLLSLTPVQPSGLGIPMSQFDKDDIDDLGLLKLDILGVKMQSSISHTLTQIQRLHGKNTARAGGLPIDAHYIAENGVIDIDSIPQHDEEVFDAIRSTHTLGMFQIESPGQRELIGKMQPDEYQDLIADISLFRPGPMKGNMVAPYIQAKHSGKHHKALHPRFTQFLADAHGVVIYHEHVIRILADCMGIDYAQADELRRRLEKETGAIETQFRKASKARVHETGERIFSDQEIEQIWKVLEGFGSFGFCKAHGVAFALPTWQSAWLKTHYPAEFMTGILEHDPGMYPKRLLIAEAKRLKIPILPIDVNLSGAGYVTERIKTKQPGKRTEAGDLGIRLGLKDIKGITGAELNRITACAPYESIHDFIERAHPSKTLLMNLALIGALDGLVSTQVKRGQIVAHVRTLNAKAKSKTKSKVTQTPESGSLIENHLEFTVLDHLPKEGETLSPLAQTQVELQVLASEIQGHVLDSYQPLLKRIGVVPAAELLSLPNRTEVFVAGVRVATQTPPMKNGKRVVFISVDDASGVVDTAFFEEAQQNSGSALFSPRLLLIAGRTSCTGKRGISITATKAWDLQEVAESTG